MSGPSFFSLCNPAPVLGNKGSSSIGAKAWECYLHLDRTQWLSAEEIEQYQLQRLRTLMQHCSQHVPYYQEIFRTAGVLPQDIQSLADFRRLPILTRRTYQERKSEFCANSLPPGVIATEIKSTSGTSGVPIEIQQTNVVAIWWLAFYLRDLEWSQINPQGSLACLRVLKTDDPETERRFREGIELPYWHPSFRDLIETGPSHGMDLNQDPRKQWEWLKRIDPNYILSYPSNLEYFASLIQNGGQRIPNLKLVQSFSETLRDDARQRIESAFGVPVKNLYSSMEAGYLASPCRAGYGLHVHAENVILEVLDEAGQPCEPGQRGRVVLTTLHNFLTPFLRYEILDEATPGTKRCPCGRGLPLLERIEGKQRPMFWLSDGRKKSSFDLLTQVRKAGGMRQWQFVQKSLGQIQIRVVPDNDWTADHPAQIQKTVDAFFEQPTQVDLQMSEFLDRPPGGKLLDLINELERASVK